MAAGPSEPRFIQSTPVLATADYPRARTFWTEVLGFDVVEEGGDPPRFGIFRRGRAIVFVDGWQAPVPPQTGWAAYFHVDDVEALRKTLAARGIDPSDIRRTEYDMLECEIGDPDGHVLCFGQDLPQQAPKQAPKQGRNGE